MICLKRSTAVILTLIFIMSCGIVHAVDETSATYTFSADKTGGIDPAGTVVGSWGTGYETVAGKFGRNSDDYSLEASLAANNTHGVDMRLGNNTLNIANNIINIKISMAYPSDEQFTKLSIMPAVNVTEAAKDAYKGSKNIDGFLTIAGDGALTFAGVSTGTTVEPDRFYAFDIYVNRITKACSLFVNGEAVTGTFTVGAGKSGVGFNYGGKIISTFTFDSLKGVQILKTPVSETTTDYRHFYIDDVYFSGSDDIVAPADPIADRIIDPSKIVAFDGDKVYLDETLKEAIISGDTTVVEAAINLDADEEVKLVSRLLPNSNDTLVLKNNTGTMYFYSIAERKATLISEDASGSSGSWSGKVDEAPSDGTGFTMTVGKSGKAESDKSLKIDSGAEPGNVLDAGFDIGISGNAAILESDRVVVSAAIKAEDYETARSLELKAASAGGTIISFEKDKTIKAGNIPIGKWKKGEWYNVTAVISLGTAEYELYVNGEKAESNLQFDAAVTKANVESFNVIQTGENNAESVTYVDDVEIYVGGYSPQKSVSKLSFTGYTAADRTAERDNGILTETQLKAAITCANSYKVYNSKFEEIAEGAVLPDEVIIVETAEDEKTLHTYRFETKFLLSEVSAEKSGSNINVNIGRIKNSSVVSESFAVIVIQLKSGKVEKVSSKTLAADSEIAPMSFEAVDGADSVEVWALDSWQNAASISQIYKFDI